MPKPKTSPLIPICELDKKYPNGVGITRTIRRGMRQIEKRQAELLAFAGSVARLTNEEEMKGGGACEDHIATLNSLIQEARSLTGIDPGYKKVYCVECGGSPYWMETKGGAR